MLPLGLRNRLAELIVDAFAEPESLRTIEALSEYCESVDGRIGVDAASRLAALGWFALEGERVRLAGGHLAHRDAICRRAAAALRALRRVPAFPDDESLHRLLGRAALLADAGLYFEVHELLEPAWMRAPDPKRVALQALIQIAVALHHAENANRDGAVSLLTEGLAKLAARRSVLPLDTGEWEVALGQTLTVLRDGGAHPPVPPWPHPASTR